MYTRYRVNIVYIDILSCLHRWHDIVNIAMSTISKRTSRTGHTCTSLLNNIVIEFCCLTKNIAIHRLCYAELSGYCHCMDKLSLNAASAAVTDHFRLVLMTHPTPAGQHFSDQQQCQHTASTCHLSPSPLHLTILNLAKQLGSPAPPLLSRVQLRCQVRALCSYLKK